MYILGISAYYHDSAAAIICDGEIIAAAQEERFTRHKHDAGFPLRSIEFCLRQAHIKLPQLDAIVFYEKPLIKFERLLETYLLNAPFGFNAFRTAIPVWLKEKLFIKRLIRTQLAELGGCEAGKLPQLYFDQHHRSHAASAYYPSPFNDALVICLDGVGEWATSSIWRGQGNRLTPVREIRFPHSLGLLYSAFTGYCGFKVNSGEYKLMGLAPYGQPKYKDLILQEVLAFDDNGGFKLNMKYFNYQCGLTMTSRYFHDLFFGAPRTPESTLDQRYMDLAASIQKVTEEVIVRLVKAATAHVESDRLCLAGGVALNCVANRVIRDRCDFSDIWIQPAAGDAGGALGCALSYWHGYLNRPKTATSPDGMHGCLLGPQYTKTQISSELESSGFSYEFLDDAELLSTTAGLLVDQKVIGWFQGRMEFGPRALGARSILADPRNPLIQAAINQKVKFREDFRPFAPAVLEEDCNDYLAMDAPSPYMLFTAKVRANDVAQSAGESAPQAIPAVTHVDGSARVQTVNGQFNPRFYQLLKTFKTLTGCGMLLNTSFNVRGEPIVCTPADAISCFDKSGLDAMIIGNFVVRKPPH